MGVISGTGISRLVGAAELHSPMGADNPRYATDGQMCYKLTIMITLTSRLIPARLKQSQETSTKYSLIWQSGREQRQRKTYGSVD